MLIVGPGDDRASSSDIEGSRLPRKFPLPYTSANTLLFSSKRKRIGVQVKREREKERD